MGKVSRALGRMDSAENQTIVLPIVNKKKSISCFNMLNDTIIGSLLRTSTLKPIYKRLKSEWEELNKDDKSDFVNVLYIPNILVFLDENTGKPLRQPYQINLLLISLPSTKYMLNANGSNITDKIQEQENSACIYWRFSGGDTGHYRCVQIHWQK